MELLDEKLCADCGQAFVIVDCELKFYEANHLQLPKRCKRCRDARKLARAMKEAEARGE